MPVPRRKTRLTPESAPITPRYPSRTESLAESKQVFHSMRRILGKQQDIITALRNEVTELSKVVKLLQNCEVLKPEQSR